MPFDATPAQKPLPSTDADLIADFRSWVERQPEDATWSWYSEACALMSYLRRDGLSLHSACAAYMRLPDALHGAVCESHRLGLITRPALLGELAKLEGR